MKKCLSLLLSLALLLSMTALVPAAQAENTVTIKIPVYDRGFEGWNVTDNYYTQWIQKEFGDPNGINVQYVAIARSAEVQDYTQMLAAGNAPDIIFHYDMPQAVAYQSEGVMQVLDMDEMKTYAPTYYEMTKDMVEAYGKLDGDPYFFFAERPEAYNWVTLIRQDWIDKVGATMPKNLEEYNDLLLKWKDAGLGYVNHQLVKDNYTYSYPFRAWPLDEKEHALYSELGVADMTWQPTHDYLKNMNWQYNAGVLDPEFYLNTDTNEAMADFVSGRAGTYDFYIASNTPVISTLLSNDPEAKVSILPISARSPGGESPQERAYWPFGMIMGVNYKTTDEARVALWKFLEWMLQDDHLFFLENGIEGENYTLSEDGLAVKVADFAGESRLSNNNNKDYWCLWEESATYPTDELNYKANLANWAPAGYEYLIEDAYKNWQTFAGFRTPDALYTTAVQSVNEYKADLNTLWQELYVKCVMATEADFEAVYDSACQEFLDAGYQEILDEKTELIEKGMYK